MPNATFKAIIRQDGSTVAGVAALVGGKARLFIRQHRESQEAYIGRVSAWIKDEQGEAMEMQPPEVLPEGAVVGEVVMRLKHALGIPRSAGERAEYDLDSAELVLK
jgi:hypothetical protein